VGSISYCIQYSARLAIGQKSNMYFANYQRNHFTRICLLTDQALGVAPRFGDSVAARGVTPRLEGTPFIARIRPGCTYSVASSCRSISTSENKFANRGVPVHHTPHTQ